MERKPFDALEDYGKAANIRIDRFFGGTQSFAASLFLRRVNMERQAKLLAEFSWPISSVAGCNGDPHAVLDKDHHLTAVPVCIFLPRLDGVEPPKPSEQLMERAQLSQWLFRNSFSSMLGDACTIADAISALLMRGYLNPSQPPTRCGLKETYEWAKAQPSTNGIAKQIESLLLAHAGPNTWRICIGGIRNDFVHGTTDRLQFIDGRFAQIVFPDVPSQRQFVNCFGPNTHVELPAFSSALFARVDKLVYDCISGDAFDWPKLR